MASKIDLYLTKYGESHQNRTNKAIHWICVPAIMFSLFGLIMTIPFPSGIDLIKNWTLVVLVLVLLYYLSLSVSMFFGFLLVGAGILFGNFTLFKAVGGHAGWMLAISGGIFAIAWVGQFIGHHIEGKKPSFLDDVKFLLIGPAWLLHFIYKKLGVRY